MSGRVAVRAALKHRNRVLHGLVQAIMAVAVCHWESILYQIIDQIETEGTGGMSERIGKDTISPQQQLRVVVVGDRGKLVAVNWRQWIGAARSLLPCAPCGSSNNMG